MVGFTPNAFVEYSGLPETFEGTCIDANVILYDYEGQSKGGPRTVVDLKIMPVPGSDIALQTPKYGASKPDMHMPSLDGRPHSPSAIGGPFFSFVGEFGLDKTTGQKTVEKGLSNSSNYAFFIEKFVNALQAAGAPLDRLATGNVKTAFRGVHGIWSRVPQPDRKFKNDEGTEKKRGEILILDKLIRYASEEEIAQLTALAASQAGSAVTPGQMPTGPGNFAMPATAPAGMFAPAPGAMPAGFQPQQAFQPAPVQTFAPAPGAAPVQAFPPVQAAPANFQGQVTQAPVGPSQESINAVSGIVVEMLRQKGPTAKPTLAILVAVDPRLNQLPDAQEVKAFITQNPTFWTHSQYFTTDASNGVVSLRPGV